MALADWDQNSTSQSSPSSPTMAWKMLVWEWNWFQFLAMAKSEASRWTSASSVGVLIDDRRADDVSKNGNFVHLSLIHISEPTRLLSISYAVFCLKKKKKNTLTNTFDTTLTPILYNPTTTYF
eukprot:TRINITY_DN8854_c0_g1_i1.p1 TRINITY_DN8854_c0_g1~~TRINITY_DN8854_c0_g1_i1.p1  ORF type:complete len:123 (+),score=30.16 TRINITY_DN8854_c0_g1_i1:753-1121(+)